MKRLLLMLVLAAAIAVAAPAAAFAHTADNPYVTDLVYGRKLVDIGDVKVWNDASYLYVKYVVTAPGWYLFNTHVEVKTRVSDIPQAKGNAVPGRFTFKEDVGFATEFTQKVPLSKWAGGTQLYIAAHADAGTKGGSIADVCATLPAQVYETYVWPSTDPAWMGDAVITGGTSIDGTYPFWCVNRFMELWTATTYPADVVCSYRLSQIPAGMIDKPENLDLVNWILNQDFAAKGWGPYSVQTAIWALLSNDPPAIYSDTRPILDDAYANGEGFVPTCGQLVGILLFPRDPVTGEYKQPNIIMRPINCVQYGNETVWGKGLGFPGNDWSMYFGYAVQ